MYQPDESPDIIGFEESFLDNGTLDRPADPTKVCGFLRFEKFLLDYSLIADTKTR